MKFRIKANRILKTLLLIIFVSFSSLMVAQVNALVIDSSGNVGLGILNPKARLDILQPEGMAMGINPGSGKSVFLGSDPLNSLQFDYSFGQALNSVHNISFTINKNDLNTDMRYFDFRVNGAGFSEGTSVMRINENGNVGISTTDPDAELDVAGTVKAEVLEVETLRIGNWELKEVNGNLIATHGDKVGVFAPLGVGDVYGGGIILQINEDGTGLVVAFEDLKRQRNGGSFNGASRFDPWEWDWIEAQQACDDYKGGGFDDWRMPDRNEMKLIYEKRNMIYGNSMAQLLPRLFKGNRYRERLKLQFKDQYWTSEEQSDRKAWRFDFENGRSDLLENKGNSLSVRPVRAF
ncbi:MAG: DUF1566 domain-containing protein [Bacteroidetes bacterium]|nr:MAG: DUF1566 domain-containing protein [Bacteroidota bacterium]